MTLLKQETCIAALFLCAAPGIHAEVTEFSDKDAWAATVGCFNTIDFTGLPDGTAMTDQFGALGILFIDGNDFATCCDTDVYPNDGAGLQGNAGVNLVFLTPQSSIAAEFPLVLNIELISGGSLIYASSDFVRPGGGFAGLVSSELFDAAVLHDPFDAAETLDDLHFGGPTDVGDVDADGSVDVVDLLLLLEAWGACPAVPTPCPADADHDGMVGATDLVALLSHWS